MFVVNLKLGAVKKYAVLFCIAAVLLYGVSLIPHSRDVYVGSAAVSGKVKDLSADTNEKRVNFLQSFGWEVVPEPAEICEISIPKEFDDVFENYNSLQKSQNFDLEKYKGKRMKKYSYEITNYPETAETVMGNVLVYNGNIVAGDVSSTALSGFMHGFGKE